MRRRFGGSGFDCRRITRGDGSRDDHVAGCVEYRCSSRPCRAKARLVVRYGALSAGAAVLLVVRPNSPRTRTARMRRNATQRSAAQRSDVDERAEPRPSTRAMLQVIERPRLSAVRTIPRS